MDFNMTLTNQNLVGSIYSHYIVVTIIATIILFLKDKLYIV